MRGMRLSVHHFSRYEYSTPITLGRHVLRLVPQGPTLRVTRRELAIEPVPMRQALVQDAQGNEVVEVEFAGTTTVLSVDSRFEAFTWPPSGLSGLALPRLPWPTLPPLVAEGSWEVAAFARDVLAQSGGDPVDFLDALSRTLFERTDRQVRWEGNARSPVETLRSATGACRDLTLLFMECSRAVGLEARFVSGYQAAADTPDGQRHLHGWPEVLLLGHGFHGWDPTHGLRVTDGHVRLCAAPTQLETMPIEGGYSFEGAELTSSLSYGVTIDTTG